MAPAPAPPAPPEEFDREHLRLLTDKLSQKTEEQRSANTRLSALVNLGLELGSDRDPQRVLQTFCHAAREIIGAKYAIAGILGDDGAQLRYFFTSGMAVEIVTRLGLPAPSRGGPETVLRGSRCLRLRNPGGNPAAIDFPTSYPPIHCWLGAPIVAPGGVYGWLGLLNKVGAEEFSEEDEHLAGILTAQVGRIYENSSLYANVLRHAAELESEVTERRRVEEHYRQAQQRLQHVVASSPAVLFTLAVVNDQIQGISWISDNLQETLGHPPEAALSPDWWLANIHPEDRARIIGETHAELLKHGRANHEYRFRHGNGNYRWTHGELRLIRDTAGRAVEVVGSWSDITERRQLEDQYRQAQKMEAVGRLAGGVAHDFNNLLTVINGYGELVLSELPAGNRMRAMIQEMVAAGTRATGLTRQLLAFSRKAIIEPKVLDLKKLVAEVDSMLRRIIGEDIQMTVVTDPAMGAVKADPGQLEQVILNLVVNARDAMPQGGRLTLEVRNAELDEAYARSHPEVRPGPHVLLAISDTGCGMDQATMARIFEPFFSTKGEKGTGLGLATVHGIIKQSGGHVGVYSEVGHGTTFKLYLPRLAQSLTVAKSPFGSSALPRGSETVLLAEDEDGVRALVSRILKSCGYTILAARDGAEADRIATQHQGKIDLLVTDVVMPEMGGRALAQRITALHPGVKVLFLSGYTDDAVVRHGILQAEVAFLQKPFSPASLAAKVREVLG